MEKYINQVTEVVSSSIREATGQDVVLGPEDELLSSGLLDSMSVLQVFLKIQEVFMMQIGFEVLTQENFNSVASISSMLCRLEEINTAA